MGTGSYKIEEYVIASGERTTTPLLVNNGFAHSGGGVYTYTTNGSDSLLYETNILTLYKYYRLKYTIDANPNATVLDSGAAAYYGNIGTLVNTVGTHILDKVASSSDDFYIWVRAGQPSGLVISNISIVEIPPLPTINTGTKLLTNVTPGTISTQQKNAYPDMQFDVFKVGAETAILLNNNISNPVSWEYVYGYVILLYSGKLYLQKGDGANNRSALIISENSYLTTNTLYTIFITRLASEGVFRELPTMQESACINNDFVNPYPTFTSNGRYGFSASVTTSTTCTAGTTDELSIISANKYLVEFDLKLNSGALPTFQLAANHGGGAASNTPTAISGKNSHILTATGTGTDVLRFITTAATNYEISNLSIKKVFPIGTFMVQILGGTFTTKTLVAPSSVVKVNGMYYSGTGIAASNPCIDNTYSTSNYLVIDNDNNDKIGNISIYNQNLV